MYLAALGNIHGNLPALRAVLDAIDAAGIQTVLNTGDCVAGLPWPNEVIDLLRGRGIFSAQGEQDRRVVHFLRKQKTLRAKCAEDDFERLRRTYEALRPENLEFLRELPRRRALTFEGIPICLCHGTPTSQADSLRADDDALRFQRARETANADLIVCGGSSPAYSRVVDTALFVNPGSVDPAETDGVAHFAIIDTEVEPWSVTIVDVGFAKT